jgi:hypothetical protein
LMGVCAFVTGLKMIHPTNNTASYDLWTDILIGGKATRICNWSSRPFVAS